MKHAREISGTEIVLVATLVEFSIGKRSRYLKLALFPVPKKNMYYLSLLM